MTTKPLSETIAALLLVLDGKGESSAKNLDQRLADAKASLVDIQTQVDSVTREREQELTDAKAEVTRLTEQFNSATTTATAAQSEVTRLTSELATMTAARDTATNGLTRANDNVSRLEKLCGLNGVDPNQAVPSQSQQQSAGLLDKFLKASPTDKVAMIRKDSVALYAEAKARGVTIG
jgi:chromosome segregation ATPase